MIEKGRLLKIANLDLSGTLETMSDNLYDVFLHDLDEFVDAFPALDGKVKDALAEKKHDALSEGIEAVCEQLISIHADGLAKECQSKVSELRDQPHERLEAYLTQFLSAVAALSIDIQMAKHSEGEALSGPLKAGQRTILAVDDASFFLNRIKAYLMDSSHKLICMTSPHTALRFVQSNKPDLFLLDIDMPEMTGYDLLREIRGKGQTAPAIFLTGNATRDYVVKAIKAGAADFLVKPASKEQVLDRIGKFI